MREQLQFSLGRNCVNRGVFPGSPRLSRLPPPLTAERNPVWRARAVLCVCELWHPPLRECGHGLGWGEQVGEDKWFKSGLIEGWICCEYEKLLLIGAG